MESASPISFRKKDFLHKLKKRDRFLQIESVDEITKNAFQGFSSAITIIGKIIVRIRLKRWDAKDQQLFITEEAERNLLGNDKLPNLGIKVLQEQAAPTVSDLWTIPRKKLVGIEVSQIEFDSDTQPCKLSDTPLQREFQLYIFNRFLELLTTTDALKIS